MSLLPSITLLVNPLSSAAPAPAPLFCGPPAPSSEPGGDATPPSLLFLLLGVLQRATKLVDLAHRYHCPLLPQEISLLLPLELLSHLGIGEDWGGGGRGPRGRGWCT